MQKAEVRLNIWTTALRKFGLKVNLDKTKAITFNFGDQIILPSSNKQGKWPCAVCGCNTGSNSVKCIICKHCPETGRPTRGRDVSSKRTKSASTPLVLFQKKRTSSQAIFFIGLLPTIPGLVEKGSAAFRMRCEKQLGTHVVLCCMYTQNHPISNLYPMQSYQPSLDI